MAKGDWLRFLSSAILVVIPAPAHSGVLTKGDHVAFAIRPVEGSGDVKTSLWSGVDVTAVTPDPSIECEESSSCYPWKMAIVSTVFWIGETGSGPTNTRSAWDKNWVSSYGGVDDPVHRSGYGPAAFRPLQNPFYVASFLAGSLLMSILIFGTCIRSDWVTVGIQMTYAVAYFLALLFLEHNQYSLDRALWTRKRE
jgi:hypothetical protein